MTAESLKGSLHRTSHGVYYCLLKTPNIPDCLDYNRIVCSLCTVIEQIYKKFLEETWFLPSTHANVTVGPGSSSVPSILVQTIQDIDTEFKNLFFGVLSKNISERAINHLKNETVSLQTLKQAVTATASPIPPLFYDPDAQNDDLDKTR